MMIESKNHCIRSASCVVPQLNSQRSKHSRNEARDQKRKKETVRITYVSIMLTRQPTAWSDSRLSPWSSYHHSISTLPNLNINRHCLLRYVPCSPTTEASPSSRSVSLHTCVQFVIWLSVSEVHIAHPRIARSLTSVSSIVTDLRNQSNCSRNAQPSLEVITGNNHIHEQSHLSGLHALVVIRRSSTSTQTIREQA